MGRPSKYNTHIKPHLQQIAEWKKNGATDQQICQQLGVSLTVFYDAKAKFPEFADVMKNSRAAFIADLRGELARLAFKHTLKTKKVYTKTENGNAVTYQEVTEKEIDGDIAAIHLLLKNLDRENWAENPQAIDIKKQELELKRLLAEANNFDLDLTGGETQ